MDNTKVWYERDYRRALVDSHIADWDEIFQSKFDPKNFVEMVKLGKATSIMVYALCHAGNAYYPTKVGHQHKNLGGRDVLGEILKLCNKEDIDVVVYYSLMFNRWYYERHPEHRIINAKGKPSGESSRHGVNCPNSPYRDFVVKQIDEICRNYEFEGLFFDMTFWPDICYCQYCKERYAKEVGGDIPRIINWEDPTWVRFQRKREKWMSEFASLVTEEVKRLKPEVAVNHQLATSLAPWQLGVPLDIAEYCDYLGGDFYGGALQHSLACKLFLNLTKNKPFEFHMSRCVDLRDHTTNKTREWLEAEVFQIVAHSGRIQFIDAIDPVGTLDRSVYKTMGKIFGQVEKYEKYLGGEMLQEVGIYFSFESKISLADNGKEVEKGEFNQDIPHLKAVMGVCKSLLNSHIPFGIITKRNLHKLSKYKVIILPEVIAMDSKEVEAFTSYVKAGGGLYASKDTSLLDKNGNRQSNFMLKELLGVSYLGMTDEDVTYISLREVDVIKDVTSGIQDLTVLGQQTRVEADKHTEIFATLTLPYTKPKDLTWFASIHSNPPGIRTKFPTITLNKFGKGSVCYASGNLEIMEYEQHRRLFIYLVKELAKGEFILETDAPKSVEITIFKQAENKRYVIHLINFQQELPNIPIHNINFGMRLDEGEKPIELIELPEGKKLPFKFSNKNLLEVNLLRLETFLMLGLQYK